uniref:carcinoembryonic antigen-related cell adhesion molecule 8-like n=1 Tax=Myodes glareolus TaxID=447135 RepID=UPI0020208CA8
SLLIYWSSPSTAQVSVKAVAHHVAEGANVLLLVHNLRETPRVFYWFKGENDDKRNEIARFITSTNVNLTGPAYSGRETIYRNGSLLLQNVTQNDTGAYTLEMIMQNFDPKTLSVQFHVHPLLPKPSITNNNSNPIKDKESVALMCDPKTENTSYLWRRNGQSLSEGDRQKLSEDKRTLTLLSVVRTDTGPYECETQNPVSKARSDPFTLNKPVTTPSIQVSNSTVKELDSVILTCSSNDTGISIHWFFNGQSLGLTDRMKLSLNNSTPSIDPVRREDSGEYQCEVSNPVSSKRSDPIQVAVIDE